jgi:hypothetical protein
MQLIYFFSKLGLKRPIVKSGLLVQKYGKLCLFSNNFWAHQILILMCIIWILHIAIFFEGFRYVGETCNFLSESFLNIKFILLLMWMTIKPDHAIWISHYHSCILNGDINLQVTTCETLDIMDYRNSISTSPYPLLKITILSRPVSILSRNYDFF